MDYHLEKLSKFYLLKGISKEDSLEKATELFSTLTTSTKRSLQNPLVDSTINSGVYMILNLVTKKKYIGSSINLSERRYHHFYDLGKGKHQDRLQKSYNKYGRENFVFIVIQHCSEEECLVVEQSFLNSQLSADKYLSSGGVDSKFTVSGYNLNPEASSPKGYRHSEKSKKLMSEIKKGKSFHSPRQMDILKTKGRLIHTEETKKRLSQLKLGTTHSQETRDKISRRCSGIGKQVLQLHRDTGKVLNEFSNQRVATDYLISLGIKSYIAGCLYGSQKTSGGFKWKFKD